MNETDYDIVDLQALLDRSHEAAGPHLRDIFTPERRIDAASLASMLTGMRLLALATVTRAGEPRVAPVDGIFYRGRFWFGSSVKSVRYRHLQSRPQVSATHTVGESLAVIVHGRATFVGHDDPDWEGFARCCRGIYGEGWDEWGAEQNAWYARIDPERMYTFQMNHDAAENDDASG